MSRDLARYEQRALALTSPIEVDRMTIFGQPAHEFSKEAILSVLAWHLRRLDAGIEHLFQKRSRP